MKLKSVFMFLGCLLGGLGGFVYWYGTTCISGDCEIGSNLFSVVLYGVFIGLFVADFISQGFSKKEA
jgi:hypothetical protein